MHKKVSFSRVGVFVLIALALLGLSRWSARATVPGTAGQGYGAISVDPTTNNIAIGTSTALSTSVFTVYSTSSVTDSMNILNSSGASVFRFSNGDLAVGANGIDTNYSITTANGGIKAENSSAQPAGYFNSNGGGPALVTLSGNVGFGTTAPSAPLHIKNANDSILTLQTSDNTWLYTSWLDSSSVRRAWVGLDNGLTSFNITTENSTSKINLNSGTIYASGNLGVGNSAPAYKLDVSGQINGSTGLCIAGDCKTAWNQVTGTNFWTQNGTSIYYNGGNVGINNSTPGNTLSVGGTIWNNGISYLNANNGVESIQTAGIRGANNSVQQVNMYDRLSIGTPSGWNAFPNAPSGGLYTYGGAVLAGNNGNVGVGTAAPAYKLDVSGNIRTTGTMYANANGTAYLCGGDDACLNDVNIANTVGIYGAQDSTKGGIRLGSAGADLYGSGGNVGVGTTAPAYKLDVNGSVDASQYCISGANCITSWPTGGSYTAGTGIVISGTTIGINTADWADLSVRAPSSAGYGSGFYQTSAPTGGWPSGASGWWLLINSQHTNTANNYAMQISGSFFDQTFYGRKTAGSGTTAWSRFITTDPGSNNVTLPSGGLTGNFGFMPKYAAWSAYGTGDGGAAIYNDNGTYKKLMVIGNNSAGGSREVGIWDNLNVYGNVTVNGGSGKLNVGTIDPVYSIGGINYATYVSGMTGQKEETAGKLSFKCSAGEKCSAVIDFANAEKGSDLWLFSKATNLSKSYDSMLVYLTPSFEGDVWYKKDASSNRLTVFAKPSESGDLEVSYRLTAPRFDAAKWTNYAEKDAKGLRPEEQ